MSNRAIRLAKSLHAKARRAKVKSYRRAKREDFRQSILARIAEKERFAVK
jgi:hypothetical protein